MRVVFFGTPDFAAKILKALYMSKACQIVAVVSKPDKAQGRNLKLQPTAVKRIAQELIPDVPIFQPVIASDPQFAENLKSLHADLFIVVAYGEIIKQFILDIPCLGCINVHGSLLPAYRGAAPIQRCLMNGDKETGISIIEMVRKMDAGAILEMRSIPIGPNETFGELEPKLADLAVQCLLKTLEDFKLGQVNKITQNESKVTFAHKIASEDCVIDWSCPAKTIHNQIRALSPEPGAWCWIQIRDQRKRLRVLRSELIGSLTHAPSLLQEDDKGLIVSCGDKRAIRLLEIQLEGKKTMSAKDFLRGVSCSSLSLSC